MPYISSTDFGRCPVDIMVAVNAKVGGWISSYTPALRSSDSALKERISREPAPRKRGNIDPAIRAPASRSRIPSSSAASQ